MDLKPVKEIREEYSACRDDTWAGFCRIYREDTRAGVQQLVRRAEKQILMLENERKRLDGMRVYEKRYRECGLICGIDEVGRGPLAGPVVACAVILPEDAEILWVDDSKKLTAARREELSDIIRGKALCFALGSADHERIDEINILQATYEAMRSAVSKLDPQPDLLLNDAVTIPDVQIRQVPIIKGDQKSISIAAASIVAKTVRDRLMEEYDRIYPQYGFASNKGYGTAGHIRALREYGPCPIHRRSFIKGII